MGEIPRANSDESGENAKSLDLTSRLPEGSPTTPIKINSQLQSGEDIVGQVDKRAERNQKSRSKLLAALGVTAVLVGGSVYEWWRTYSEIDPVSRQQIELQAKDHELHPKEYRHFQVGNKVKVQKMDTKIHPNAADGGVNVRKDDPAGSSEQARAEGDDFLVESPVIFEDSHGKQWAGFVSEEHKPVGGGEYFVSITQGQGVIDLANNTVYQYNTQDPRLVEMTITGTYDVGITAKDKDGKEQIVATAVKEGE